MERVKPEINFKDKYVGFIIISIGIILFIVSFCAAYLFLINGYTIEDYASLSEPLFKLGFLGLLIWTALLVTRSGMEFYEKSK